MLLNVCLSKAAMPFALPCFQGWLWSDGGRGRAHTPCVLGCRLQLWLQSQAVPAPQPLTQPCGAAGWQTYCHPHLHLCPSKPALVWGVRFSGHAPFPASFTNIFSRHSLICRKFLCSASFSTTGDDRQELSHHCHILVWPRPHELSVYVWERQLSSFESWDKYSFVNLI